MRQYLLRIGVFLTMMLVACGSPITPADSINPVSRPDIGTLTPLTITPPAETEIVYQPSCYFNWARQPLPELSSQVQTALEEAGLTGVTARAEAYGENCYDSQTNEVIYFAALETDFRVTLDVPNLEDSEHLGNMLEEALIVLDKFPSRAFKSTSALTKIKTQCTLPFEQFFEQSFFL